MRSGVLTPSALLVAALAVGCSEAQEPAPPAALSSSPVAPPAAAASASLEINPRLLRRFRPLPESFDGGADRSTARVELGRALFHDPRLSQDGDLSCNSCHDLSDYGADHERTSDGHRHQRGSRNAPTVYNAAGFFVQFWDGRAPSVEEQAKGPILNPVEMAMGAPDHVVARLRAIPAYVEAFARAFAGQAEPITFDNAASAIGAFERGLVTPGRWDRYLRGDLAALSAPEKEGLRTFLNVGCMTCHTGPYLGGSMYERVGVVEPWPNQADRGREALTGNPADEMLFKVPTLRNIARTAPYFHDGSVETLPEAVRMMGRHQLGIELEEREIGSIVTWLESLTGELPLAYIRGPAERPVR